MATQAAKAQAFRALHERDAAFIIPNPWDIGSARVLEHVGFEALATTSMGFAFSMGKLDTTIDRGATLAHVASIVAATPLPVSADLENGYGDAPEIVAETIRLAAAAGIVGGSIEDATGRTADPIYERQFAVERIRAAVEAARALPFTFTLTARAENFLHGRENLDDTIQRLQAYVEAGADVVYAPGLRTKEDIAAVVKAVSRPVNALMGLQGVVLTLAELSELGVKRVSVGSALYRTAMGAFLRAANEMRRDGSFGFAADAAGSRDLSRIFSQDGD
ncbi:MAG TPA: isocitrate lyase/phosphoenolpyruvate mutase family protein [Vicinamibacterales bacterium]